MARGHVKIVEERSLDKRDYVCDKQTLCENN